MDKLTIVFILLVVTQMAAVVFFLLASMRYQKQIRTLESTIAAMKYEAMAGSLADANQFKQKGIQ